MSGDRNTAIGNTPSGDSNSLTFTQHKTHSAKHLQGSQLRSKMTEANLWSSSTIVQIPENCDLFQDRLRSANSYKDHQKLDSGIKLPVPIRC